MGHFDAGNGYDESTAKGAKLLDTILPGWYKQVDLSNLHMQSSQLCMLGQLFGTRVEGQLAREMYPEEYAKAKEKALAPNRTQAETTPTNAHRGMRGATFRRLC